MLMTDILELDVYLVSAGCLTFIIVGCNIYIFSP